MDTPYKSDLLLFNDTNSICIFFIICQQLFYEFVLRFNYIIFFSKYVLFFSILTFTNSFSSLYLFFFYSLASNSSIIYIQRTTKLYIKTP